MIQRTFRPLLYSLLVAWIPAPPAFGELLRTATDNVVRARLADTTKQLTEIVEYVESSNAIRLVGAERWKALLAGYREGIEASRTHAQFAAMVNRLFRATGVSHFHYYTDEDWSYWHLRGALGPDRRNARVEHIGIFPERIAGRWFVRGILEGSLAQLKDIRVGDELVSVNGAPYRPVTSLRGKAGVPTVIELRRTPGATHTVVITPQVESLHRVMQTAIRKSISIVEVDGLEMAYMHGWTLLGTGREYGDLLELQDQVDGLLLDYRDGFGGTWYNASQFLVGYGGDDGDVQVPPKWTKPVVILIDDGTRSAKEIVVDAVKRADRAPLVGEPAPGAVTAVGGVVSIGEDGLLLLPGFSFELEGNPTQPDYLVERDIRYCAGADPQLDAAKEILTRLIRPSSPDDRTSR